MYRSCHTAATCEQTLPHFEYLIYVHWPGAASASPRQGHSQWQTAFTVRRLWSNIVSFYRVLQSEVIYDPQHNILRTELPLPALPNEDDIHEWISATGAAGDVKTLSRTEQLRYLPHSEAWEAKDALHERHDNLTRRVDHFLKRACKVLNTLSSEVLVRCAGLRPFLTPPPDSSTGSFSYPFFGPQPLHVEGARPQSAKPSETFSRSSADATRDSALAAPLSSSGQTRPSTAGALLQSERTHSSRTSLAVDTIEEGRRSSIASASASSSQKKLQRPMSSPAHLTREPPRGATEDDDPSIRVKSRSHHLMMFRAMPPDEAGCSGAFMWQHRQEAKHLRHKAIMSRSRSIGAASERRSSHSESKRTHSMKELMSPCRTPESAKSPWSPSSPDARDGAQDSPASGNASVGGKFKKALMKSNSFVNADQGRQERQLRLMYKTMRSSFWERTHRDICEGFRTVVFGRNVVKGSQRHAPRTRRAAIRGAGASEATAMKLGSQEQVHELFKMFRSLVQKDRAPKTKGIAAAENVCASASTALEALLREKDAPNEQDGKMLDPVRWETLLAWVENERSYAVSIQDRKHCDKLAEGLARVQAELSWQVPRVSLPMIMQLIWPHAGLESVGQMLCWIAAAELERHREPEPPPLDEHGQKQLVDLFHLLDVDGSGKISAEELAESAEGGKGHLLDADVVRAVVGNDDLTVDQFLEYMCEDGNRPTDTSTKAFRDGQELRLESWGEVGWKGWVRVNGRSEDMEKHYQWLKELQAEVVWWRRKAKDEKSPARDTGQLSRSQSPQATSPKSNVSKFRSRLQSVMTMVNTTAKNKSKHENEDSDEEPASPVQGVHNIALRANAAVADVKRWTVTQANDSGEGPKDGAKLAKKLAKFAPNVKQA